MVLGQIPRLVLVVVIAFVVEAVLVVVLLVPPGGVWLEETKKWEADLGYSKSRKKATQELLRKQDGAPKWIKNKTETT